ncbi:MAG: helix-turn-helix transcriptional regulator [Solirubrobacterales bacterium]|nr:helix-turn-helix transcriptional regulator [Solirubrobacterales bacterium]
MSDSIAQTCRVSAQVGVPASGANPGSIIRLARLARGETQTQTGRACGFSQSQISRIESGKAYAYDIRHLSRLARHLDIPPHLLGLAPASGDPSEPPVNRREFVTSAAAAIAGVGLPAAFGRDHRALRAAGGGEVDVGFTSELVRSRWLGGGADNARAVDLTELRQAVARAKTDYQGCRYAQTAAALPSLLARLEAAASASTGDDLLAVEALAADAYHVVASLQLKLGNEGPAWMAADASMRAAQRSRDPIVMASSARIVTHVLMDAGRNRDAERLARGMGEKLSATWSKPAADALAVYGSLLLRGAIAAARAGNAPSADDLLNEADDVGRRLGGDGNLRWTAFGPTNVRLHRINVATTLGNAGDALKRARGVQLNTIPITERRASFLIDVAGAYLQWEKHEQAYQALCVAERLAPQELAGRPAVHELITATWARAPAGLSRRVEELARRTGVAV